MKDRIRAARTTGLRNLPPLHDTAQNQIGLEIAQLALDLLARMPMLALTGDIRRWEPRRLRLFSAPVQLVTTARRQHLRPSPWHDSEPFRAQADQPVPVPASSTTPTGAVEPGAHPT